MNRRSVEFAFVVALCSAIASGCSSHQPQTAGPALDPFGSVSPGLIAPAPEATEPAWANYQMPSDLAWLASRNDTHQVPDTRIPEVADPGSYWVQTRDYQRTINGRPWNLWTTQTWIEQRGSGR